MSEKTKDFVEIWKNHKAPKKVITVDDYFKKLTKEEFNKRKWYAETISKTTETAEFSPIILQTQNIKDEGKERLLIAFFEGGDVKKSEIEYLVENEKVRVR